jgi:hypothetical protein
MLAALLNAPLWVFLICLFGAIFAWLAADQFRDQLVSDSHRLVRQVALRYLQITIGLFTLFIIGMLWAVGRFATQSVESFIGLPEVEMRETPTTTPTFDPFFGPAASSTPVTPSEGEFAPTGNLEPTPTDVPTAQVANTAGLGVNMREQAGYDGAIVIVVSEGATVILLGETEESDGILWHHVQTDAGIQGWIADLYLNLGE